jgi:hypothetical protein
MIPFKIKTPPLGIPIQIYTKYQGASVRAFPGRYIFLQNTLMIYKAPKEKILHVKVHGWFKYEGDCYWKVIPNTLKIRI